MSYEPSQALTLGQILTMRLHAQYAHKYKHIECELLVVYEMRVLVINVDKSLSVLDKAEFVKNWQELK